MSVPDNLLPTHSEKIINAMKAPRSVKRITFNPSEANPGETLNVHAPKLNKKEVLVPGSLALRFDIDLSGGHANNFLVQNVLRTLMSQLVVKFGGTILEDTVDYDVYKTFSDLFLPGDKRDNMVPQGIQREDLCIFYPQSLYNDLVFEVTLAPVSQVVKRSDPTKLKHKPTNIELEYEMIHSEMLVEKGDERLHHRQRVCL